MKVNLMRKIWKEKVTVPVLQKQVDKILGEIDVKLKKRRKNVR